MRRRFLIIAASIGSGHMKAAEALAEKISEKMPEATVAVEDFTRRDVSFANALMKAGYLWMLRLIPNLYWILYRFTGGKAGGLSVQGLISLVTSGDADALIRRHSPDVVIATHPFPAGAVSRIKRNHPGKFLFSTVITDYSVHQMWIYEDVDMYFVARESMKTALAAAGIDPARVFVTGIPISEGFGEMDKRQARRELGIDEAGVVVLLMGGGLGLGDMESALSELGACATPLTVLVVAGKNDGLKKKAEETAARSAQRIVVFGYAENVSTLMAAASFIITKPGALTISEALAASLPMLLAGPIPGPETENAAYAESAGAAVWVRDERKLGEAIRSLASSPETLARMRAAAGRISRPDAAKKIAEKFLGAKAGI